MKINRDELMLCVMKIEAFLGEDVSWSLGTITNDRHGVRPYGKGVCVTLSGPAGTVFEKDSTDFLKATARAIERYQVKIDEQRSAV
jgi:hypothetical protein